MNNLTTLQVFSRALFGDSEKLSEVDFVERILDILPNLTPREQKVLEMRFGLASGITHTLEEVGKEFAVTRERIRQIEAKALSRIRYTYETKT